MPCPADILIMETTFGRPHYQFPPSRTTLSDMVEFCRESLAKGITPVLLAYSLGKSQELLRGLADANLAILLNEQVRKMTRIYEHFGHRFPAYEKFRAAEAVGKVLLWPPSGLRFSTRPKVAPMRTAVFTGWALDAGCRYRYGTDAAFPLSDHADFDELLELAKLVAPREIFTLHGFAADFAQTLRERGYHAYALSEDEQLCLPF
jgi:DNA ligase-1